MPWICPDHPWAPAVSADREPTDAGGRFVLVQSSLGCAGRNVGHGHCGHSGGDHRSHVCSCRRQRKIDLAMRTPSKASRSIDDCDHATFFRIHPNRGAVKDWLGTHYFSIRRNSPRWPCGGWVSSAGKPIPFVSNVSTQRRRDLEDHSGMNPYSRARDD
jgi:hypothetical protein